MPAYMQDLGKMLKDSSLSLRHSSSDTSFPDLGWKYLDWFFVCTECMVGRVHLYAQQSILHLYHITSSSEQQNFTLLKLHFTASAYKTISAMISSNYIAAIHNITCPSTCTTYWALTTPLMHKTNTRHSWQNGTRWRDGVKVSLPSSLAGFWGFHPYMRLFSFRKLSLLFGLQNNHNHLLKLVQVTHSRSWRKDKNSMMV